MSPVPVPGGRASPPRSRGGPAVPPPRRLRAGLGPAGPGRNADVRGTRDRIPRPLPLAAARASRDRTGDAPGPRAAGRAPRAPAGRGATAQLVGARIGCRLPAAQESLPWLASLLGLALDARWPAASRRSLLRQAYDLFRIRGTQACLERILRLYLPVPVAIVESWRLRGLAGAVLGAPARLAPAPAVGGPGAAGARGRFTLGGPPPGADRDTLTAHRFTMLVAGAQDAAQRDGVHELLESHKPAHTMAEVCELGPGMRVGRHLHVGLSSVVGPVTGWGEMIVGQVLVGADGVLGLPAVGSRTGTARAGQVRVG